MFKKIILLFLLSFNTLFSSQVEELLWPRGDSFLSFLEKNDIPLKLFYNLDKEDKELCSEIQSGSRFYLYSDDEGNFQQVLIPVSNEIQLHIYKDDDEYKFQTLPINYTEKTELIAVPINESLSSDLQKATGDIAVPALIGLLFKHSPVDFKKMKKGDYVVVEYTQKVYLGKLLGLPNIKSVMVEINKKPNYRFKNEKDEKYYDDKGVSYTKTYPFQIPLTYTRISSQFHNKRYHPVLKRYRAHLGTDFAAPTGRNVYAASDGRISFVGNRGGYGKTVIINHANGYKTLYAHLSRYASNAVIGRTVKKGTLIAHVGSTGISTGPHLHLGLYKNGVAVDPMKTLKKPKVEVLSKKEKDIFMANSKKTIELFQEKIDLNEQINPEKLDRIYDRTIINLF
ncbi:peptidoglycan DD-metalloendopeptidase family protein [Arcobacter porcinus]|uniref:Murein DD-endopeptidase MepM n=1 Tax=Arcobacter porcinus TaxID=1935204 RepID=A0A1C0AYT7_9BACT|nr:peptidoglycan DD-metalloendopeptidase family protein [Arcobacter porcinus]OCL96549.1 Murein DD-endopeptidase MepM [Aliarcobacter thereius]OCL83599.1 Murein DD-endopeptidase MepM [Arcobacter porcinus]OCL83818.1 Murein DD-endopeptidase MepM [Arcobacter porcinus]OCL85915.1 Murein DD-endopeptidase MepM [Arcobacter porcinus]OCL92811.1 Murein DD-endopeptidase MepM [Arcobacter porcinus]